MPYLRIWVHFIFPTSNCEPLLNYGVRTQLIKQLRTISREHSIFLDHMGGWKDHLHCLISLGKRQSIEEVARTLQNESSKWINDNQITPENFEWDHHYYAVSVNESDIKNVREYIRNQEKQHKFSSFENELNQFAKKYGWKKLAAADSVED